MLLPVENFPIWWTKYIYFSRIEVLTFIVLSNFQPPLGDAIPSTAVYYESIKQDMDVETDTTKIEETGCSEPPEIVESNEQQNDQHQEQK